MEMPIGSNVLFQSIAHNPTGVDPTLEQWKAILKICKERNLLIILDNAYQGFVSGDLQKDNFVIKLMVEENMNFILTSSFSKNFGLYGQRLGCILIVTNNNDEARKVFSQIKLIQRSTISQPVTHSAHIVSIIYNDESLWEEYNLEMKSIVERIVSTRKRLVQELELRKVPGDWKHIQRQTGMFSFTGLTPEQS